MLDYTECFSYDWKDGTKKNEVICGVQTFKNETIVSSERASREKR